MCSSNIIEATVKGGGAGALALGPVGAVAGATLAGATETAKEVIPEVPEPKIPDLPDESAKQDRERRRALRRLVAGRAGPGRRATIRPQGTGTGPTGLKQKTGQ
jgi:hypothetical protein